MVERLGYVPTLNKNELAVYLEKLYYRRGTQVDIMRSLRPILLSDKYSFGNAMTEPLIAIKRNATGFWDRERQDFINTPEFVGFSDQDNHLRHSPERLKNETEKLIQLNAHPEFSCFVPRVFILDDSSVATEYVPGHSLKDLIKLDSFTYDERERVLFQIMYGVYLLHAKVGLFHNDLVAGNVQILPNNRVLFLDFALCSDSQEAIDYQKRDIVLLNEIITRVATKGTTRIGRALLDGELNPFRSIESILKSAPFRDEDFVEKFETFITKNQNLIL